MDKESLCVLAGQRVRAILLHTIDPSSHVIWAQVWHIRLTIHVLSNSGNMVDCACLAGIVALKHFRRPEVEVVGDEVTIVRTTFFSLLLAPLYSDIMY